MAQLKSTSVTGNLSVTGNTIASQFIKSNSDDTKILLGGGGEKPISDFTTSIENAATAASTAQIDISSHKNNQTNPHGVTKNQVGLGNVDNTSDENKPVSTLQAEAIQNAANALLGSSDDDADDNTIYGVKAAISTVATTATNASDAADAAQERADDAYALADKKTTLTEVLANCPTKTEAQGWANAVLGDKDDKKDVATVYGARALASEANTAAATAQNTADAALPKAGGTMTGPLSFQTKNNDNQTCSYLAKPVADWRFPTSGLYDDETEKNETYAKGAITISLPEGIKNTMLSAWIDVYNYGENTSFSVYVGGYTYTPAGAPHWINCSSLVYGAAHKIRFSYYNNRFIIYIGEVDSKWSYPQITVRNVLLGHSVSSCYAQWQNKWDIAFSKEILADNPSHIIAKTNRVWTTDSSTGLNADTLDGHHADYFATQSALDTLSTTLTTEISNREAGDNARLPLSGSSTSSTTNNMTGPIVFKDANGIILNSNNKDVKVWSVWGNSGAYAEQYGFHLLYKGTNSGNDNTLQLYAHAETGTHQEVYSIKQNGTTTWNKNIKFSSEADINTLKISNLTNFNGSDYTNVIVQGGSSSTTLQCRTKSQFVEDLGLSTVFIYKGTLADLTALKELSTARVGDVYFISDTSESWACKQAVEENTDVTDENLSTYWTNLGNSVNLEGYVTTASVTNNDQTLSWGSTTIIGSVGGTELTITMPSNPDTNTHYKASLFVGSSMNGAQNTDGITNPYLKLYEITGENSYLNRSSIQLNGINGITVSSVLESGKPSITFEKSITEHTINSGNNAQGESIVSSTAVSENDPLSNTISLGASGVRADTYGPQDTDTLELGYGETFSVPQIQVNAQGIVIGAESKTVQLPASDNTDTQVNLIDRGTTKAYLLGTSTAPSNSTQAVTSLADSNVYLDTTAGQLTATILQSTSLRLTNSQDGNTWNAGFEYNTADKCIDVKFH